MRPGVDSLVLLVQLVKLRVNTGKTQTATAANHAFYVGASAVKESGFT